MLVENHKKRVIQVGVDLVPGVNTLNKDQTEIFLKEIETAERYQENGIITVLDKDVTKLDTNILDLSVKEITKIIKKTFHVKELETLMDEETEGKGRGSVIKAIENQITFVHSQIKDDKDKDKNKD